MYTFVQSLWKGPEVKIQPIDSQPSSNEQQNSSQFQEQTRANPQFQDASLSLPTKLNRFKIVLLALFPRLKYKSKPEPRVEFVPKLKPAAEPSVGFVPKSEFFSNEDGLLLRTLTGRRESLPYYENPDCRHSYSSPHHGYSLPKMSERRISVSDHLRSMVHRFPAFRTVMKSKEAIDAAHLFAEQHFMPETPLFLCAVIEYQHFCQKNPTERHYLAFRTVTQRFIVPGSPHQLNISDKLGQKLVKYMVGESEYLALLPELKHRIRVFAPIYREMENLFWTNLYSEADRGEKLAQAVLNFF